MRATKAYIASLGTTGLLLAFSASLLILVGTLFAFDAWPGGDIRDAVDSVFVDDEDEAVKVTGPEQVALDASPAALAVAGGQGDGAGAPGSGNTGGDLGGTGGTGGGGGAGSPGGDLGGGTGGGGGTGDGVTTPGGGSPVPSAPSVDTGQRTNELADGTEQITNNVGDTVGQVNPDLGNTVTETGESLSDIVRDLPDVNVGDGGVQVGGVQVGGG